MFLKNMIEQCLPIFFLLYFLSVQFLFICLIAKIKISWAIKKVIRFSWSLTFLGVAYVFMHESEYHFLLNKNVMVYYFYISSYIFLIIEVWFRWTNAHPEAAQLIDYTPKRYRVVLFHWIFDTQVFWLVEYYLLVNEFVLF